MTTYRRDRRDLIEVGAYAAACRNRAHRRSWWVAQYRHNRSAFNGYRYTPSAYSQVRCEACGAIWRSKARYVDELPRDLATLRLYATTR